MKEAENEIYRWIMRGETIRNVYLCKGKRSAETRNGKPYDNLILQDKTGTLDGKVWDPNSQESQIMMRRTLLKFLEM